MGMERRGNGRYYYRKERKGGRVVSTYMGGGEIGVLYAELDALERAERAEQQAAEAAERAAWQEVRQAVEPVASLAGQAAAALLTAQGYHRHKGQWRRRRHGPKKAD